MRKPAKALVLVLVSLLASIGLTIGAAFSAALAFGAVALIVPGTGTPNANIVDNYLEQARNRYLTTTACGADGSGCPDANLQGINYPASFFPLVIFPNWCRSGPQGCDTWNDSVGQGTNGGPLGPGLNSAIGDALNDPNNPNQDVVVFGYSQGGAVVADSLAGYINGLTDEQKARIQIVTIGGIENQDGGLWQRLAFLRYIPILNVSFDPAIKPDAGVNITSYAFHFDPVADAPRYWGNPFALLNAVAALETVHGYYLSPNGNGPTDTLPYGYTDATLPAALACNVGTNCRVDSYGNKYIVIPATSLPLADLILSSTPAALTPIVKPLVDLVAPAYRVLAELGYDYSGDPSVPTPLSILPFSLSTNPVKVATDLIAAVVKGIQDAGGDLGGATSTLAPATVPVTTPMLAQRSAAPQIAEKTAAVTSSNVVQVASVDTTQNATDATAADAKGADATGAADQTAADKKAADAKASDDQAAADTKAADEKAAADKAADAKAAADKAAADAKAADAKAAADKKASDDKAAADKKASDDKAAADKKADDKKADDKKADDKKADDKKDASQPDKSDAGTSDKKDSGGDANKAAA